MRFFFRSPWSNKYDPPLDDGAVPSDNGRKIEIEANQAFEHYKDMYFEGGISSVYVWDTDNGFAMCVLIKKTGDGSKLVKGCWDSIHVIDAVVRLKRVVLLYSFLLQVKSGGRQAHYKLTSTVMLWLQTSKVESGLMNLGGSLTRQVIQHVFLLCSKPSPYSKNKTAP